jgi:hypothetical protein
VGGGLVTSGEGYVEWGWPGGGTGLRGRGEWWVAEARVDAFGFGFFQVA